MVVHFLEQSFARVQDWSSWGINMQPLGHWEFTGHAFPGRPRIFLKYDGCNQKSVLTKQAKDAGARIINHLPIMDVLVEDGRVVGAVGLDVKGPQPKIKLIRTKSVVLGTGTANRLYPSAMSPGLHVQHRLLPKQHRDGPCGGLPGRGQAGQHGNAQPSRRPQVFLTLRQGHVDRCVQGPPRQTDRAVL